MKMLALNLLHKIATVLVALLLYGVIAILQMPKAARAAQDFDLPPAQGANSSSVQRELGVLHQLAPLDDFVPDQRGERFGRAAHRD